MPNPASPAQRDYIDNLAVDIGLNSRAAKFGYCETTLGRPIHGWDDMNSRDASVVINRMKEQHGRIKDIRPEDEEDYADTLPLAIARAIAKMAKE